MVDAFVVYDALNPFADIAWSEWNVTIILFVDDSIVLGGVAIMQYLPRTVVSPREDSSLTST